MLLGLDSLFSFKSGAIIIEHNYLEDSLKENNAIKYEHYKQLKRESAKYNSIKDLNFSTALLLLLNYFWGSFYYQLQKLEAMPNDKNWTTIAYLIIGLLYFLTGLRPRKRVSDYLPPKRL